MGFTVSWRSQKGMKTEDNRDCGGIGLRNEEALCVILDGSTAAPDSGALARQIARKLIDWYVACDAAITATTLVTHLRQLHTELAREHPLASAGYMIAHVRNPDKILVLHAGDCLLGEWDGESEIAWLTRPHTLASAADEVSIAAISNLPARHLLTRSFRPREFMPPAEDEIRMEKEIVMATDGLWAELIPMDQARFVDGHDVPMPADGDDRSVLRIRHAGSAGEAGARTTEISSDGFYVRSRS